MKKKKRRNTPGQQRAKNCTFGKTFGILFVELKICTVIELFMLSNLIVLVF